MRIILAEDSTLLRESLVALLERLGHTVCATAVDAPGLRHEVVRASAAGALPDLVITDVRMPPGQGNDGLVAALELRRGHPGLPVLVLSQYIADAYATELLAADGAGVGYLLKDRIGRIADFAGSLETVAGGGTVIDPDVVRHLLSRGGSRALDALTPRESETLALMARGHSNAELAAALVLSDAAVGKHIGNIFMKLGLDPADGNRRVKAVLTWLQRHT